MFYFGFFEIKFLYYFENIHLLKLVNKHQKWLFFPFLCWCVQIFWRVGFQQSFENESLEHWEFNNYYRFTTKKGQFMYHWRLLIPRSGHVTMLDTEKIKARVSKATSKIHTKLPKFLFFCLFIFQKNI